jgi:4-oxalocrotonate tautomerase
MIQKLTDAMVSIEGENGHGVIWVKTSEVASGEWGIRGQPLTTEAVKDLTAEQKGGREARPQSGIFLQIAYPPVRHAPQPAARCRSH